MICQECGIEVDEKEYHPLGFCVLYNAGIDPYDFIKEAITHIGKWLMEKETDEHGETPSMKADRLGWEAEYGKDD